MTHYSTPGDVVVICPENDKVVTLSHPLLWDFTRHRLPVNPSGEFAPAEAFDMAFPRNRYAWP